MTINYLGNQNHHLWFGVHLLKDKFKEKCQKNQILYSIKKLLDINVGTWLLYNCGKFIHIPTPESWCEPHWTWVRLPKGKYEKTGSAEPDTVKSCYPWRLAKDSSSILNKVGPFHEIKPLACIMSNIKMNMICFLF